MSSHLYPEVSVHLLAVTPTAHWLEYVDWAKPVLAEPPLRIVAGNAIAPSVPAWSRWDDARSASTGCRDAFAATGTR